MKITLFERKPSYTWDPALTKEQMQVAGLALQNLLKKSYFDVCLFDHLVKFLNREEFCRGKDYEAVRLLHCVHWSEMTVDIEEYVKATILQILGATLCQP